MTVLHLLVFSFCLYLCVSVCFFAACLYFLLNQGLFVVSPFPACSLHLYNFKVLYLSISISLTLHISTGQNREV